MVKRLLFLPLLGLLFTNYAGAEKGEKPLTICDNKEIRRLELPLAPSDSKSRKFKLAYRVFEPYGRRNPEGTIVWLLGGPGSPAFLKFNAAPPRPTSFRHVVFDIRGIECSRFPGQTTNPDFFSTERIAADTASLIHALQLKDYVILAASYGTVHARVLANLLERDHINLPRRIIMEGTMIRAFTAGGKEVVEEFSKQWDSAVANVPESVQAAFVNKDRLPLGLSPQEWGTSAMNALSFGSFPEYKDGAWVKTNFVQYILGVAATGTPESQENLKHLLAQINLHTSRSEDEIFVYRQITCREISDTNNEQAVLTKDGHLQVVKGAHSFCLGIPLDRPYDSSKYRTAIPIFYFQGSADPATPAWMVEEKFKEQGREEDRYVAVIDAAHSSIEQSLSDCWDDLWTKLVGEKIDLESALSTCRMRTKIESGKLGKK